MPSSLLLIAVNLLPLGGVLFWGWDAFVLLILYWFETAVIAFWAIVRVTSRAGLADSEIRFANSTRQPGPIGTALFLTLHAGIFMGVHFVFLWVLFSGTWPEIVHGPRDFFVKLVVDTGLWAPLLVIFLVRGAYEIRDRLLRRLASDDPPSPESKLVLVGLYVRIFVMQLTIILGGFFAMAAGSNVFALALLVAIKTAVDLAVDRIAGSVKDSVAKANDESRAG